MTAKRPRSSKSSGKEPPRRPGSGKSSRGSGKGGGKPGKPFGWRIHLILLLSSILLVALVWFARRHETEPPQVPPVKPPVTTSLDLPAVAREQAEAFLASAAIPAGSIRRDPAEQPRHYLVQHRQPDGKPVEQLRQRLHRLNPPLSLATPEDGVLAIEDGNGTRLVSIQFLPLPPPPIHPSTTASLRGSRVAIIVDDLGRGLNQVKQLLDIPQPVTYSILPGEPHAAEVAALVHARGGEVMLHAPMEPQGYPVVDPGDDALLVNQSDAEIREHLKALLTKVPHAIGTNNHMGSRFTENARAMAAVMSVLHERGLFFVDSLTSSHSVGGDAAREAGVPQLRRDVFLDNVAEVELIVREIRRLAEKGRRPGGAVGICHPYPETIRALRQELPRLAGQGVVFVPVSALLKGGG